MKLLQTYLHLSSFPLDLFSIVLWWILCRETVFRTVKNDKNNSGVFGDSVKKRLEVWYVREETKVRRCQVSFLNQLIIKWMNRQRRQHCFYLRSKTLKWLPLTGPFPFLIPKILTCQCFYLLRSRGNKRTIRYKYSVIFVLVLGVIRILQSSVGY